MIIHVPMVLQIQIGAVLVLAIVRVARPDIGHIAELSVLIFPPAKRVIQNVPLRVYKGNTE